MKRKLEKAINRIRCNKKLQLGEKSVNRSGFNDLAKFSGYHRKSRFNAFTKFSFHPIIFVVFVLIVSIDWCKVDVESLR